MMKKRKKIISQKKLDKTFQRVYITAMKLSTYLKLNDIPIDLASKQLGVSKAYVYELVSERKAPGRKLAQQIIEWAKGDIRYEDLWK